MEINFTHLEKLVINGVKALDKCKVDCTVCRLEESIYSTSKEVVDAKVLRGAISSLVKKEKLTVDEGYISLITA